MGTDEVETDEDEYPGVPSTIEPGKIAFTYEFSFDKETSTLVDIAFEWDGSSSATWNHDISDYNSGLSVMSSAPCHGWISWFSGRDLLMAYSWEELCIDGWARIPNGAPGEDIRADEVIYDPQSWLTIAKSITTVLWPGPAPGTVSGTYDW